MKILISFSIAYDNKIVITRKSEYFSDFLFIINYFLLYMFKLIKTVSGFREGMLNEIRTPAFIIHTNRGIVPHMLREYYDKFSQLIQVYFYEIMPHMQAVTEYGKGINAYYNHATKLTFLCTTNSPNLTLQNASNNANSVSITTNTGNHKYVDN